jgi:hypothetical protein
MFCDGQTLTIYYFDKLSKNVKILKLMSNLRHFLQSNNHFVL